jgi:hypothetical protein
MRASFTLIGEPKPHKGIPTFPSEFHSAPRSLRAALQATASPKMDGWRNTHTREFDEGPWRNECQGLTSDGGAWYISSNSADFRGIYKYSLDFKQFFGKVALPAGSGDHIGDIDYHDGVIYVPISKPAPKVWEIDGNLKTLRIRSVSNNPNPGLGWCAINPWNGYLYSCPGGDGIVSIRAYDPKNAFAPKGDLRLGGDPVNEIQGGCFSENGHLYLTSDKYVGNHKGTQDIRAYSALNGAFLGSCPVSYDATDFPGAAEEMEGIAICRLVHPEGDSTYVHVVILDNDASDAWDDVYLKHFAVPNPADV